MMCFPSQTFRWNTFINVCASAEWKKSNLWSFMTNNTIIINMKLGLRPVEKYWINNHKCFKSTRPGEQTHGCLFHLTNNLRLQISELDLISKYKNDTDFSKNDFDLGTN